MKRLLSLTLVSLLLYSYQSSAQLTSCAQTLRLAQSIYEQGRLHEVTAILQNCINTGFNQQEKVAAYKLLTLTYLFLEEPEKANESMLNLLRTDHYFEINESTDPAEFIALYKTFRTTPIYRIGGKVGANVSQPNVIESIKANEGESEYKYKFGIQVHVAAEIPLRKNLTLNPEIGFVQRNFQYNNEVTFTDTTFLTEGIENQSWISVPVSLQYEFKKIKFKPYISAGIETNFLLNDNLTLTRSRKGYALVEEKTFSMKDQRQNITLQALISAGMRIPLGGGFVITEIRFSYGLTEANTTETAFSGNSNLPFTYGYADSVFKVNSLSVTVGYVYNIFNPKKLK